MNYIDSRLWTTALVKTYPEFNQEDKKNLSLTSKGFKDSIESVGKFHEVGEIYLEIIRYAEEINCNQLAKLKIHQYFKPRFVRKMVDISILIHKLRLSSECFPALEKELDTQGLSEFFKRIALRQPRSDFEKTWYVLVLDFARQKPSNDKNRILDSYNYVLVNAPFLNPFERGIIIKDVVESIFKNSNVRDFKSAYQKLCYISPNKDEFEGYELLNLDCILQSNVDQVLNFIQILSEKIEQENGTLDLIEFLPNEIKKKILTFPIGKEKIKECLVYAKSKIYNYICNAKFEKNEIPQVLNLVDYLPNQLWWKSYIGIAKKFDLDKCLNGLFYKDLNKIRNLLEQEGLNGS
jgi:hypothetical protein